MAEYFDANEVIVSESLSENEASDESGLSDVTTSNSEPEEGHGTSLTFCSDSSGFNPQPQIDLNYTLRNVAHLYL